MNEEFDKLAKEIKEFEGTIANLETLIYIKKNWIHLKYRNTQTDLQQESIHNNICPFCLNHIDWDKLEKLIAKYNKELGVSKKYLKGVNKKIA